MDKTEWLRRWKNEIIESGYYFLLDVEAIQKGLAEKETTDLTPAESAFIYISLGKEWWSMSDNERNETERFVMESRGG